MKKIASETIKEREERLKKERACKRASTMKKIASETIKEREERLKKERACKRASTMKKIASETIKEREERLKKERACKRASTMKKIASETIKEREERLKKERVRKRASRMKQFLSKCSKRQLTLEKDRVHKRICRQNESSEARQNRLLKSRSYKKNTQSTKSRQRDVNNLSANNCATEVNKLIQNFHLSVSVGPLYICTCCDQLWYKHSVCPAERIRLTCPDTVKYLRNVRSVDNIEWVCNTCCNHLKKKQVPPCAAANGMKFPNKPDFFDLNELECQLVAPRLAFQKIFQAPRGRQLKITGNAVNVPADVNTTVNMLPRLADDTGTIKVQLKRRLQYKSCALSLNIRPNKVMHAAAWLANTSRLYQDEGITVDENWLRNLQDSMETGNGTETLDDGENQVTSNCSEDEWSEDEVEIPAGVTDSMLTPPDFVNDDERQEIYNFAPGEGNRPLSVFRDQYSEEMAYPGIFLGQKRPDDKQRLRNVHYSEICKSELRRSDRRAAMCVENIFFKAKKLQMKFLLGQSQIALRKNKMGNRTLTAGELKTPEGLQRLINHDDGFRFLRTLRGSPPYFEKAKKDLFAMIRQLGPASLFCSFSSAETKWNHLLRILGKHGEPIWIFSMS